MKHVIYDRSGAVIRPFAQLGYKDESHIASLTDADAKVAFRLQDGKIYILYRTDHDIENLQSIARKFGFISVNTEVDNKSDIYNKMTSRALGLNGEAEAVSIGNVELFSPSNGYRTPIDKDVIEAAGYNDGAELWHVETWPIDIRYKTLFPQIVEKGEDWIIATPIMDYGTVLDKTQFAAYIDECALEEDMMEYDSENNNLILGIADSETEALVVVELLAEWEEHLMSASVLTRPEGKELYDYIVAEAIDSQDKTIEKICEAVGITTERKVIEAVTRIYGIFNCESGNIAYERLRMLLFHELWIVVPRART